MKLLWKINSINIAHCQQLWRFVQACSLRPKRPKDHRIFVKHISNAKKACSHKNDPDQYREFIEFDSMTAVEHSLI